MSVLTALVITVGAWTTAAALVIALRIGRPREGNDEHAGRQF